MKARKWQIAFGLHTGVRRRRADSIVHTMMQHASGGSGQRTPTDINLLVSEHIDLAYHGKRARVQDLTLEIKRDLDEVDGEALLVPQEIGRVLLNRLVSWNGSSSRRKTKGRQTEVHRPPQNVNSQSL